MPIYVYQCDEGHLAEIMTKADSAPHQLHCKDCGGKMIRSYKNLNISGKVEGGTNGGSKLGR